MSINFENDMGPEAKGIIEKMTEVCAMDERTALLNTAKLNQQKLKEIANAAKQPATLELNSIGDKKLVDGAMYVLTKDGWRKDYTAPIKTEDGLRHQRQANQIKALEKEFKLWKRKAEVRMARADFLQREVNKLVKVLQRRDAEIETLKAQTNDS